MSWLTKKRVAWLSVASNTTLTAIKLGAGLMTGSVSILSEAAHSAMDLIAAGIATFSVHVSDIPPDRDHPYGHEKVENVSGVIEGLLIFGAAGWIIYEAVGKLIGGVELQGLGPGLVVMAISAVVNLIVAGRLKSVSIAERSVALEADAAHLYTDVYTSAAVFVGLAAITAGERFFGVDLSWLDPVIAMAVALLIMGAAFRITRKSFLPLLDVAASEEELATIEQTLDEFAGTGCDYHKIRTRRAGGSLHVDLHIGCRPGVTLDQGHGISHAIKAGIEENLPGARVLIHVEPSKIARSLAKDDERYRRIESELVADRSVTGICGLEVIEYREELRVETELTLDPKLSFAESSALSDRLGSRIAACLAEVKETVIKLRPGDGWQDAIHDDDQKRIHELLGEHEGAFAGVHQIKVSSAGGRHFVQIRLGVPGLLPVEDAHKIGEHLRDDIESLFADKAEIDLHIEPCDRNCESCKADCPERLQPGIR
ncbi:MAG: cation-efflux pump [Planctomycetota bacterium]